MTQSFEVLRTELMAVMASAAPGAAAVDELCRACVDLLDVDGAAVSVINSVTSRATVGSSDELGRQLDEYQFTFGEGPCLEATTRRVAVLVPDLDSPYERRWPAFAEAVLGHGVRGIVAMPIMMGPRSVGALDLFRREPGSLRGDELAAAALAANLAGRALQELVHSDHLGAEPGRDARPHLDRIEVYQATGVLMSQLDVDADEGLLRLRAHALATNQTASEVAWAIIEGRLLLPRDNTL